MSHASFFFFFGCSHSTGRHTCKVARSPSSAWGVGVRTLLVQSIRGNALCTHLLTQASVGLNPADGHGGQRLFRPAGRPGSLPTKTPGCLHQSRWRSMLFVEHLAHVPCTSLVSSAFLSNRYLLVSRQSICILSFNFLYHRLRTARSEWSYSVSSRILLSHRRTQIRCADSDIRILYNRFFAVSGRPFSLVKPASPHPRTAPRTWGSDSVWT